MKLRNRVSQSSKERQTKQSRKTKPLAKKTQRKRIARSDSPSIPDQSPSSSLHQCQIQNQFSESTYNTIQYVNCDEDIDQDQILLEGEGTMMDVSSNQVLDEDPLKTPPLKEEKEECIIDEIKDDSIDKINISASAISEADCRPPNFVQEIFVDGAESTIYLDNQLNYDLKASGPMQDSINSINVLSKTERNPIVLNKDFPTEISNSMMAEPPIDMFILENNQAANFNQKNILQNVFFFESSAQMNNTSGVNSESILDFQPSDLFIDTSACQSNQSKLEPYSLTSTISLANSLEKKSVEILKPRSCELLEIPITLQETSNVTNTFLEENNKSQDTKFYCVYCKKLVRNFISHMVSYHKTDEAVARYVSLMKHNNKNNFEMKQKIIQELKSKSNKVYNQEMFINCSLITDETALLVSQTTSNSELACDELIKCLSCESLFSKQSFYKHVKVCVEKEITDELDKSNEDSPRNYSVSIREVDQNEFEKNYQNGLQQDETSFDSNHELYSGPGKNELGSNEIKSNVEYILGTESESFIQIPLSTVVESGNKDENVGSINITHSKDMLSNNSVDEYLVNNNESLTYIESKKPIMPKNPNMEKEKSSSRNNKVKLKDKVESLIYNGRKRHFCLYCKRLVTNFRRHLFCKHDKEEPMIRCLALSSDKLLNKKTVELRMSKIINEVQSEGDYIYNQNILKDPILKLNKASQLLLSKRPSIKNRKHINCDNYAACKFCKNLFLKKILYRHVKNCLKGKENNKKKYTDSNGNRSVLENRSEVEKDCSSILNKQNNKGQPNNLKENIFKTCPTLRNMCAVEKNTPGIEKPLEPQSNDNISENISNISSCGFAEVSLNMETLPKVSLTNRSVSDYSAKVNDLNSETLERNRGGKDDLDSNGIKSNVGYILGTEDESLIEMPSSTVVESGNKDEQVGSINIAHYKDVLSNNSVDEYIVNNNGSLTYIESRTISDIDSSTVISKNLNMEKKKSSCNNKIKSNDKVEQKESSILNGRKRHFCLYCKKVRTNIEAHFYRKHYKEEPIIRCLALKNDKHLDKKTMKLRVSKIINEVQSKGDYIHNMNILTDPVLRITKASELIFSKRPRRNRRKKIHYDDCVTCNYCKKLFLKIHWIRHVNKCTEIKENRKIDSDDHALYFGNSLKITGSNILKGRKNIHETKGINTDKRIVETCLNSKEKNCNVRVRDSSLDNKLIEDLSPNTPHNSITACNINNDSRNGDVDNCENIKLMPSPTCSSKTSKLNGKVSKMIDFPAAEKELDYDTVPHENKSVCSKKSCDGMSVKKNSEIFRHKKNSHNITERKYYCIYCKKLVSNFCKHIFIKHKKENPIVRCLALKNSKLLPKSVLRFRMAKIIRQVKSKGNYVYSQNILKNSILGSTNASQLLPLRNLIVKNSTKNICDTEVSRKPCMNSFCGTKPNMRTRKYNKVNRAENGNNGKKTLVEKDKWPKICAKPQLQLNELNLILKDFFLPMINESKAGQAALNDSILYSVTLNSLWRNINEDFDSVFNSAQKILCAGKLWVKMQKNDSSIKQFKDCLDVVKVDVLVDHIKDLCSISETGDKIPNVTMLKNFSCVLDDAAYEVVTATKSDFSISEEKANEIEMNLMKFLDMKNERFKVFTPQTVLNKNRNGEENFEHHKRLCSGSLRNAFEQKLGKNKPSNRVIKLKSIQSHQDSKMRKKTSSFHKITSFLDKHSSFIEKKYYLKLRHSDRFKSTKFLFKKNFCMFCETLVNNFRRHVTNHIDTNKNIAGWKILMRLRSEKNSGSRLKIIENLRRKGNLKYYSNMLCNFSTKKTINLKLKETLSKCSFNNTSNLSSLFNKTNLLNHNNCNIEGKDCDLTNPKCVGNCHINKPYANINLNCLKTCLQFQPVLPTVSVKFKEELFFYKDDAISETAIKDPLLLSAINKSLQNHPNYYWNIALRRIRDGGRLLMSIKERDTNVTGFHQCIHPLKIDLVFEAVKELCKYDENTGKVGVCDMPSRLSWVINEVVYQALSQVNSHESIAESNKLCIQEDIKKFLDLKFLKFKVLMTPSENNCSDKLIVSGLSPNLDDENNCQEDTSLQSQSYSLVQNSIKNREINEKSGGYKNLYLKCTKTNNAIKKFGILHTLEPDLIPEVSEKLREHFVPLLKKDAIADTALNDPLLMKVICNLYEKISSENNSRLRVSSKLRDGGKLLMCIRKKDDSVTQFGDCLNSSKIHVVLEAVKDICGLNEKTGDINIVSMPARLSWVIENLACRIIKEAKCNPCLSDYEKASIKNDIKNFLVLKRNYWRDTFVKYWLFKKKSKKEVNLHSSSDSDDDDTSGDKEIVLRDVKKQNSNILSRDDKNSQESKSRHKTKSWISRESEEVLDDESNQNSDIGVSKHNINEKKILQDSSVDGSRESEEILNKESNQDSCSGVSIHQINKKNTLEYSSEDDLCKKEKTLNKRKKWSDAEKRQVICEFRNFIVKGINPGRERCRKLIASSKLLANTTVHQLNTCINNINSGKLKLPSEFRYLKSSSANS